MIMTKVVMRKEVFSRIHLIIEISLKIHVAHYFSTKPYTSHVFSHISRNVSFVNEPSTIQHANACQPMNNFEIARPLKLALFCTTLSITSSFIHALSPLSVPIAYFNRECQQNLSQTNFNNKLDFSFYS